MQRFVVTMCPSRAERERESGMAVSPTEVAAAYIIIRGMINAAAVHPEHSMLPGQQASERANIFCQVAGVRTPS